ncbi:MAG: hypothetical protein ACTSV1_00920 [Alphaproteobacteria bacterium]
MNINKSIDAIERFQGSSLTQELAKIEQEIVGLNASSSQSYCAREEIDDELLNSALAIKKMAGQINVIIHAAGILRSLQEILEPGENIESVSLGAGNTGKKFDLETNFRIAEYKFIDWQGGPESIRQNSIFKDFYELAEYETSKRKFLYVIGTKVPLKFFQGGRALTSVLSRLPNIHTAIVEKYGSDVAKVRDYYRLKKDEVLICDVSAHIGRDGIQAAGGATGDK